MARSHVRTQGGDGTRSAGASAWSAKISPADLHPGWKPPPELKAEVQPPFWQNLRPKPGDGQNPFEPLTSTFQARRDTMGSPTPGHDVGAMRGGWPAGGTYFKSTGSWGGEGATSPPMTGAPGSGPKYGWRHQQFTRPSPTRGM